MTVITRHSLPLCNHISSPMLQRGRYMPRWQRCQVPDIAGEGRQRPNMGTESRNPNVCGRQRRFGGGGRPPGGPIARGVISPLRNSRSRTTPTLRFSPIREIFAPAPAPAAWKADTPARRQQVLPRRCRQRAVDSRSSARPGATTSPTALPRLVGTGRGGPDPVTDDRPARRDPLFRLHPALN